MIDKIISDYWTNKIRETFKDKYDINNFYDKDLLFEYSVIGDNYKIYYNKICNSLQLYKIVSILELFKKESNKDILICSYGESEKSIEFCINDIFKNLEFENEMKNKDWTKYCLKSIYHQSEKEEFYVKVHKVCMAVPTGFKGCKELCFDSECFEGQNMNTERTFMKCSLIGSLYKVVEIPKTFKKSKYKMQTIFDFIN